LTSCRIIGSRRPLKFVGCLVSYLVRLIEIYPSTRIELLSTVTALHIYDQTEPYEGPCSQLPSSERMRTECRTRQIRVEFAVENIALGQIPLPVLRLSPDSIFPPLFHTLSFTWHLSYLTASLDNALNE
jgi:hypothetical protein